MSRIRVGQEHESANREVAVQFTMSVLRHATDWQEGQHALADHPMIGPWLRAKPDALAESESIIREAENRLGDSLPSNYSN